MAKSAKGTEVKVEKLDSEFRIIKWIGIAVCSGLFYALWDVKDDIGDVKTHSLKALLHHTYTFHVPESEVKGVSQFGNQ